MSSMFLSLSTLFLAMTSIQIGASFAKQLFPLIGVISATALRLSMASMSLLAIFRPWRFSFTRKQMGIIALYGTSLGCMNLCFYLAIQRIPLGVAVSLEFCGPLALAFLSSRRMLDVFWVALALAGILLILPLNYSSELDIIGVFFALMAGLAWALYVYFGAMAASTVPGGQAAALGMTTAALLILPLAFFSGVYHRISADILPMALLVALLSSALPYSLEMISLKRLSKTTFSVLMSIEPVIAAVMGYIFLAEELMPLQWLAVVFIVIASFGTSISAVNNQR